MESLNDNRPKRSEKPARPCSKCGVANLFGYWHCYKCEFAVAYESDAERAEVYQINLKAQDKKKGVVIRSQSESKYMRVQNTSTGAVINSPTKSAYNLQSKGTHKIIGRG